MPPRFKFTKEEMLKAALELCAEEGFSALTARALARRLQSSSKPIFGLFRNMEELEAAVLEAAGRHYADCIREGMASGEYPPYMGSGMAYIRFARREPELFKMLFMRDRGEQKKEPEDRGDGEAAIAAVMEASGLSRAAAEQLHLEMWALVHGIAVMEATHYLDWSEEAAARVLRDVYPALRERFREEDQKHGSNPNREAHQAL